MRKFKPKSFFLFVLLICFLLIIFLVPVKYFNGENREEIEEIFEDKETSLSLVMVGDCLIHGAIYDDARDNSNNTYNFYKMVTNMKDVISSYDLAYYNQESIIGGTSLGLSTYPRFNSPVEVADAFIDLGFNLVSLANNHTLDRGKTAIYNSLDYWNSKENVLTAGSYRTEQDKNIPKIREINDITYTLLSYTTSTNGLPIYKDEPYLVDVFEKEKVKEDIEKVRDKVDLLMVAMHWGEEYSHNPNNEQKEIAEFLASLGVDIVIGSHPHVIQPVDFIGKTMVVYSLGNFIASQYGVEKLTGLVFSVDVKKKTSKDGVFITFDNLKADLSYVYSKMGKYRHGYSVYPYKMLNDELLEGYKNYYQKYIGIATKLSDKITYDEIN